MHVGYVTIGDFRQITRCNSKTVQDKCIVSIKVKKEVVCALSNGDIAGDPMTPNPQTTSISTFWVAFRIFVVGEHRDFKFQM